MGTYILTQFVIMMILFVGIMSTSLALENNLSAEKGKKAAKKTAAKANPTVQAIAHLACKGKAKCMAIKTKGASKCKLAKFPLKAANAAVKAYKAALSKKSVKGQVKASGAFKKAMAPVAACNITPKKMAGAFKRGFKIVKGKKAKKAAKKAKKATKKTKKAAKKGKKAKKAVKKGKKAAKKGGKKAAKKGKKAKKSAYKAIVSALVALMKLC